MLIRGPVCTLAARSACLAAQSFINMHAECPSMHCHRDELGHSMEYANFGNSSRQANSPNRACDRVSASMEPPQPSCVRRTLRGASWPVSSILVSVGCTQRVFANMCKRIEDCSRSGMQHNLSLHSPCSHKMLTN
eukprot:1144962-Pelagomonas_calceolata.AAC.5